VQSDSTARADIFAPEEKGYTFASGVLWVLIPAEALPCLKKKSKDEGEKPLDNLIYWSI